MSTTDPLGFVDYVHGLGLSDTTVRNHDQTIKRMWRWCYANSVDPATINPTQIRTFAEQCFPNTWASRKMLRASLRMWLRYRVRTDG